MTEFDLKHKAEQQLREIIGSNRPGTDFHAAAETQLAKMLWWRDFWTKGIVAWIALIIALISLIWQIAKEY